MVTKVFKMSSKAVNTCTHTRLKVYGALSLGGSFETVKPSRDARNCEDSTHTRLKVYDALSLGGSFETVKPSRDAIKL